MKLNWEDFTTAYKVDFLAEFENGYAEVYKITDSSGNWPSDFTVYVRYGNNEYYERASLITQGQRLAENWITLQEME